MSKKRRKHAEVPPPPRTFSADLPDLGIAVGLALIVLLRPWRDGTSFPGLNAYFIWATMILAAVWAARLFFGQSAFRSARLARPLGAFVLIAALTSFDSYLPDSTYRGLLYWSASFFLFVLAANALSTPLARGIFFTAFALTMTLSAAWALVHLRYVLPQLREAIENPQTRQYFFQSAELAPELAHRMSVNRAFGATLFPNALAALMILAAPFLACEAIAAALDWRRLTSGRAESDSVSWQRALALGAGVALALAVAARVLVPFVYTSVTGDSDWRSNTAMVLGLTIAGPISLGAALAIALKSVGGARTWCFLQLILLPPATLLVLAALYKTYSRGGMLALAVAAALLVGLLLYRRSRFTSIPSPLVGALLAAAILLARAANAQDAAVPAEGIEADILSGGSFLARLDYWQVALNMIVDNPLSGVGLGAFGAAFANYTFPNAASSQMAHNDFLQAFAETGIAGFVALTVFWAAFFAVIARKLLTSRDAATALRLAGPAFGVFAFVVHACVDFNFANPSLAMTAFLLAGAACARATDWSLSPPATPLRSTQSIAILLLLVVALVTGATLRIFLADYALTGPMPTAQKLLIAGNRLEIRDKLHASRFYLDQLAEHEADPQRVLYSGYESLLRIVPNHERIARFAFFATLDTSQGVRFIPVTPGEAFPPNTLAVITDVADARAALFETAVALLDHLESIDSTYPYILEVSMHASQWCELIYTHAQDDETRRRFALLGETWAARSVERSPNLHAAWLVHAKALWRRASTEPVDGSRYYDEGLNAYKRAAELYPSAPANWEHYANALELLGSRYKEAGHTQKGEAMLSEALRVREHIAALAAQWNNV